jgi:DNA-binding NarL/FixJ family response regulator
MCPTNPEQLGPAGKKILIVDDHPVMRRGLAALIESEPDFTVCGEAASCAEALEAIRQSPPDLVIVDLVLGDDDGLSLIKAMKIRHPDIPSLVLSMHDESVYAERSLRAGAMGYVSKQQLDDDILHAIRRLFDGEPYLSPTLEQRLAAKYLGGQAPESDSPVDTLSNRELQVFRLIGQGKTTREIAETLTLSIKTIESHRENIKHKLALKSSAELAQRATQWVESIGRAG